MAHTLVNAENGVVYVRVFNPGNSEICVKTNTEIALLAPVSCVCDSFPWNDVCNVQTGSVSDELPDFLFEVLQQGCENLSKEQAMEFKKFLLGRKSVFADPKMPTERARIGEHRINLSDDRPFKDRVRRVPIFKRDILDAEIENLLKQGLIDREIK